MLDVSTSDELGRKMRETLYCDDMLQVRDEFVFPFVLKSFPRRGRSVQISANGLTGEPLGTPIRVANPLPGPYPVWQPAAGPPTARSGDLVATLREFRHGRPHPDWPDSKEDLFRLSFPGSSSAAFEWSAESVEVADATGNIWSVTTEGDALQTAVRSGELHITCPSLELSEEQAFKVRLTLARIGNLPARETGVLREVPVPGEGVLFRQHRAVTIQGSTVEMTHQIGDRASHDLGWAGGGPEFALSVRDPPAGRVLRIRYPESRVWERPAFRSYSGWYCVVAPNSAVGKRISLEVGLTPTRTLEFVVRPARTVSTPSEGK
jgi:hypothetical protein